MPMGLTRASRSIELYVTWGVNERRTRLQMRSSRWGASISRILRKGACLSDAVKPQEWSRSPSLPAHRKVLPLRSLLLTNDELQRLRNLSTRFRVVIERGHFDTVAGIELWSRCFPCGISDTTPSVFLSAAKLLTSFLLRIGQRMDCD